MIDVNKILIGVFGIIYLFLVVRCMFSKKIFWRFVPLALGGVGFLVFGFILSYDLWGFIFLKFFLVVVTLWILIYIISVEKVVLFRPNVFLKREVKKSR